MFDLRDTLLAYHPMTNTYKCTQSSYQFETYFHRFLVSVCLINCIQDRGPVCNGDARCGLYKSVKQSSDVVSYCTSPVYLSETSIKLSPITALPPTMNGYCLRIPNRADFGKRDETRHRSCCAQLYKKSLDTIPARAVAIAEDDDR